MILILLFKTCYIQSKLEIYHYCRILTFLKKNHKLFQKYVFLTKIVLTIKNIINNMKLG